MTDRLAAARGAFEEQQVPVRLYEGDSRVMVAAPMPGLEPQDISVAVEGHRVTLHGALRGPRQDERDLTVAEWAIGPYHRELTLPQTVDGAHANATYGNGVLVLVLPKAARSGRAMHFTLDVLEATRGVHVGHTGRGLQQTTLAAQRRRRERAVEQATEQPPEQAHQTAEHAQHAAERQARPSSGRRRPEEPVNV